MTDLVAEDTGERRSGELTLTKQDQTAYIPRSPELSNLQSAIEAYFLKERRDVVEDVGENTERRGATPSPAGQKLRIWEVDDDRRLFRRFEQTDIRWINSLFAEGFRKFRGRHPFVERPARATPIRLGDDNVRLVIVGDWGSGIPRAQKLARAMRRELESVQGWERHVIHLGDVYYSGWKYEYDQRFLNYWPVHKDEAEVIGSFNLNGNHDMYSGGWDYFDHALADRRFAHWQGPSSLFQLENRFWQFFGMDTSHEDGGLAGTQIEWMLEKNQAGRKTALLSHHQYCSAYEEPPKTLIEKIAPVLSKMKVTAWLWGHEHRCLSYKDVDGIRFPRCLGHGGVPVYQTRGAFDPLPKPGDWEYREYIDGGIELWAKFGFATLDLQGDTIYMRYLDEDGLEVRNEVLS